MTANTLTVDVEASVDGNREFGKERMTTLITIKVPIKQKISSISFQQKKQIIQTKIQKFKNYFFKKKTKIQK